MDVRPVGLLVEYLGDLPELAGGTSQLTKIVRGYRFAIPTLSSPKRFGSLTAVPGVKYREYYSRLIAQLTGWQRINQRWSAGSEFWKGELIILTLSAS